MLKIYYVFKAVILKRRSRKWKPVHGRQHRNKDQRAFLRRRKKQKKRRLKLELRRKDWSKKINKLQPNKLDKRFKKLKESMNLAKNGTTMQFMEQQLLQLWKQSHSLQMSFIISSFKSLPTYSVKLFAHETLNWCVDMISRHLRTELQANSRFSLV